MTSRWDVRPAQVAWLLVGLVVLLVVSYVLDVSIGGIVLGLFLYYGTRPVYERVHEYVGERHVSAALALSTVGIPRLLVIGYATLVAYQEAAALPNSPVADDLQQLLRLIVDARSLVSREQWMALLRGNTALLGKYATSLFTWGVRLFITVTVAYYLLRDGHDVGEWVHDSFEDYGAVAFLDWRHKMELVILSYALGAEAFGWWGVFFGPIVLVVFLHFNAPHPPTARPGSLRALHGRLTASLASHRRSRKEGGRKEGDE